MFGKKRETKEEVKMTENMTQEKELEKSQTGTTEFEQQKKEKTKDAETLGEQKLQSQQPGKEKTIEVSEGEYKKLNEELTSYKDKYLRLFAEFDNARKRQERERLEFVKYANEELITQFLGILDDLERSLEAAKVKHEDYGAFLQGVEMIMSRIQELLKKNNVRPIEALGKKFDPHCHEILMMAESDKDEDDTVVEVFQKGYYLGDKVVRTAKVKVAKRKQEGS